MTTLSAAAPGLGAEEEVGEETRELRADSKLGVWSAATAGDWSQLRLRKQFEEEVAASWSTPAEAEAEAEAEPEPEPVDELLLFISCQLKLFGLAPPPKKPSFSIPE